MSDSTPPVPFVPPNMPPTDVQQLAMTVGGLSTRMGGFEDRMSKLEATSSNQHKEAMSHVSSLTTRMDQGFNHLSQEMRTSWDAIRKDMQAGRDSMTQEMHARSKTPWQLIWQSCTVALGVVSIIGGLVAYSINNNIARVEGTASSNIVRLDQDQKTFEKEVRTMIVPRDEIKIVTDLRNKMIDALEKRLEKLEGRTAR